MSLKQRLKIIEEEKQKIIDLHKNDISFKILGGSHTYEQYTFFFLSSESIQNDDCTINISVKNKIIDIKKIINELVVTRISKVKFE